MARPVRAVLVFLLEQLGGIVSSVAGMAVVLIVLNHFGYHVRVERRSAGRLEIPAELIPADPDAARKFVVELETHLSSPVQRRGRQPRPPKVRP